MPTSCAVTAPMPGCMRCNSSAAITRRSRAPRSKPRPEGMALRVIKRWLRSDAAVRLGCWLIHVYTRLVWLTGRWTIEGEEIPQRFHAAGRPVILAFWHGRLLMMPYCWDRRVPMHMLISAHTDGRLIAGAVKYFGI